MAGLLSCRETMSLRSMLMNAAAAALYAALTMALLPLSYGPVQVRLSEALTLLAFVNRKFLPGLVAGCFAANLASPLGPVDLIFGTAATWLALWPMRYMKTMWAASLCPVIANGLVIAAELVYTADIPLAAYGVTALYVGAGEFLAVTIVGQGLMKLLLSRPVIAELLLKNK